MILRNPYRITEVLREDETIPLADGHRLTGLAWCLREADRLEAGGIAARVIRGSRDAERNPTCYLVRKRKGCAIGD